MSELHWRGRSVPIEALDEFFDIDCEKGTIVRKVPAGNRKAGANAVRIGSAGYGFVSCLGTDLPAHRVIWAARHKRWPEKVVDHINGDKTDNRICNLRDVSQTVNQQNQRKARKDSRSGLIGAIWLEARKCWKAEVSINGVSKMIGRYKTAEDAHAAYVEAKRRLHPGCTL